MKMNRTITFSFDGQYLSADELDQLVKASNEFKNASIHIKQTSNPGEYMGSYTTTTITLTEGAP